MANTISRNTVQAGGDHSIIAYPAEIGGVQTRVLRAGVEGPPVIFVHGVGARADRWRRNLAAIAASGRRCFAIDLPGHGFAYKGKGFEYGAFGYASFISRFIDEQELSGVHLVGSSLGGHIAGIVACERPGLLRSLSLIGATGMFPIGDESRAAIAARLVDLSREGIERKMKNVIYDESLLTRAYLDEEAAINNSPKAAESFRMLADYFKTDLDRDVVGERLAALDPFPPTLLVWGEEDRSVPLAVGLKTRRLLRKADFEVIPRTAHAPYWEDPDTFNVVLERFLDSAG
ncbi:alpha/beta fold hydrolase [Pusillimonas noertemannii]|uniref:alpha/beta fold hydrolase n=1 Tax=Pusillimonas noertemannii TaxID=305977 RepID=UPI00036469B9|nr:alpha/beta fold hydrolase [Pusillimonas noertemannii]